MGSTQRSWLHYPMQPTGIQLSKARCNAAEVSHDVHATISIITRGVTLAASPLTYAARTCVEFPNLYPKVDDIAAHRRHSDRHKNTCVFLVINILLYGPTIGFLNVSTIVHILLCNGPFSAGLGK